MASHNIVVDLRFGKGGIQTKTSATKNVLKMKESHSDKGNLSIQSLTRSIRTIRTADLGNLGLFGGTANAAFSLAQEDIKLANKGVDIFLDINLAKTGETVGVGNIKRIKGYMLNPSKFVKDSFYGVYLNDLRIRRQNQENQYYRELTGNMIVGNQYGNSR